MQHACKAVRPSATMASARAPASRRSVPGGTSPVKLGSEVAVTAYVATGPNVEVQAPLIRREHERRPPRLVSCVHWSACVENRLHEVRSDPVRS